MAVHEQAPSVTVQYRKPIRGSLIWWLRFLGLAAFLVLFSLFIQDRPLDWLLHIDARWVGLCMALALIQLLLEALAWQWLLSIQRINHPYPQTTLAYLASQYLGLVTPGHVGEFLAAGYISMDTGISFGYALSSVVMKKALSWVVIIGFGIWGLQLLSQVQMLQGVRWIVLTIVAIVVILSVAITLWAISMRHLVRKWERRSPWQIEMTDFWGGMRQFASVKLLIPLGIIGLSFCLLFLQLDVVLRSLQVNLPFLLIGQITAFSRLVARVIPVSIAGFGTKDAAVIGLLKNQGVDPSVGLTATLIWLVSSYLVALVISALAWWIKPLTVRRVVQTSS